MKRVWVGLALVVGLAGWGGPVRAAAPPDGPQIDRLIAGLGSSKYAERESATRALNAVGERAWGALRKAAAANTDFECRLRALRLLERIEYRSAQGSAFSKALLEVIDEASERAVLRPARAELAGWALQGVYRQLGKEFPADLPRRLRGPLNETLLEALLRDAYSRAYPKGPPEGAQAVFDEAVRHMLRRFDPDAAWGIGLPWNRWIPSKPGLKLASDDRSGMVRVVTPIKGGPAYSAGIRAGDLITHVTPAGKDGMAAKGPVSTRGLTVEQVEQLLLGDSEARVRLTVQREGSPRPLGFEFKLGYPWPETVLGSRRRADDEWDYWLDPKAKIGYVRIADFQRDTVRDLTRAMRVLTRQGMEGLALDLRFNSGRRWLKGAIDVADLFIDDGLIVRVRSRVREEFKASGKRAGSLLGFPVVCLINGETAKYSEVVAACLQDHKRARIVGERSRGQGAVQNIVQVGDSELKLTTAVFYRPSGGKLDWRRLPGRPADEWGVTPDAGLVVALSEAERERLRDGLERAENIYLRGRAPAAGQDRQRDFALALLRRQLAAPKRAGRPGRLPCER